ncbi:ATP-dependent DNA ligase [Mesorhizobium sp. CA13]|uniref:ATP-dependent DNA ligase n=1 Tax=unclassified Mesorhizobium TaxID=325217 RepID=UPI00112A6F2E|nr:MULTISPECIES: ATP-dependent DNA ligase [unclassified Mesorhizobium]MBZ9856461.1 ATP-dependent DNA ligase [Mesorhizobium sp. CA13]MBZ9922190.1 ATP-dependent DNA ligase [Mesorhizobium sp. BR1-1-7]MCA0011909.1 ATP-dependent DNA ligase [Mesorhizobium sp. B294B1A1]MCA0038163.1 ATP-dependent DNA ligase [Mesorhizobium sp. B292B1B]TPM44101.1 ATP-dependent DNA ligase [Mesorhizobium sp. B2-3-2]
MSTSAPFPLSTDTAPMEAKRADAIPDDQGVWQYEPKWDGFRCLAFKAGDAVDIRAKSGKPLARYFPELVEFLRDLSGTQIVIDGEILIECCGEYSFDALQMRLHPAESRIRKLAVETPAKLMLFDMLADQTGQILTDRPLSERRAALEALVKSIGNAGIELSPATLDFKQAQKWLGDSGGKTDGVVAKQLDGPYLPGERAMVKVKRMRTADCVVGGFRYLAERREVGSLLLGLYDEDGKLDHVGFTSTISNDERAALTGRLEALRESPGFTGNAPGGPSRWSTQRSGDWEPLRPELVVEVRFDHVTGNRFRHGTKLLRWRPDKAPRQCTFDQLR